MKPKNPIKSLAGQTAVYGMGTIVPRLLNYFLVPIYTRVFDQDAYGQITELYAYVAFFMVLLTYGMETAFFRFAQKHDSKKVFGTALSAIILTTSLFLLLLLIFYQALAHQIRYEGNPEYILFIGLIVALDALTAIPFALLRKQNKARRFAVIKLANVSLNIALNLLFIIIIPQHALNWSADIFGSHSGLVVWVFIANLISSLLSLILLWPQLQFFSWQLQRSLLKPMLNYALPVLVVGLAGMINEVIDKILLKYLLPHPETAMTELGVYGANYKLGILMTLFVQMFRYAAEPFFFAEADKKDSGKLFARVMNYFVIFGLIIFLLVTLFLDIFKHFIGTNYHAGLTIVPVVLMANLFYGVFFNLSVWYKLTDKTHIGALISIMGASITLVLNILLIPLIGYLGAAWAHFVCYFFMMVVSYWWGRKIYPVPYKLKRLGLYFLLALLIYYSAGYLNGFFLVWKYFISFALLAIFAAVGLFIETKASKYP